MFYSVNIKLGLTLHYDCVLKNNKIISLFKLLNQLSYLKRYVCLRVSID